MEANKGAVAQANNLTLSIKNGYLIETCTVCGAKRKRKAQHNLPLIQQHDFSKCCEK